jgi:FixJ family two-component response regulator
MRRKRGATELKTLFGSVSEEVHKVARKGLSRLTEREREVFSLTARGITARQMATELGISKRTVEIYRSNIMHKLCARNFAEAMRMVSVAERPTSSGDDDRSNRAGPKRHAD